MILIPTLQVLWKRALIWTMLDHQHLTRCLGLNTGVFGNVSVVYEWVENGNIHQYMNSHPGASRPVLVPALRTHITNDLTLLFIKVVARRRGVEIPPRPRSRPWRFERGQSVNHTGRQIAD